MLIGCNGGPGGGDGPEGGEDGPRITLTAPLADEGRYGTSVEVTYDVERFTLDASAIDGADVEGVGHVHVYLDGVSVGETAEGAFTLADVPSGDHAIEVRLATNDHEEPWEGSAVSMRTLDPQLSIVSPTDATLLTASNTPLVLDLADFDVSRETAFGPATFGQGRYRILVDDIEVDLGFDPTTTEVSPLAEGAHTVRVELVTADGQPIEPPVFDEVSLSVTAGAPYIAVDRTDYLGTYASAAAPLAVTALNAPLDYHLYLDGVFARRATTDTSLLHVPPGYHFVELRLTDGGSELPVHDHLHLFVTDERPDIRITAPGDQWGVSPELDITVETENFTLDPDLGGGLVPGHGNWSVAVDGAELAESATGAAHLSGLPAGDHALRVELRNNDRTPLVPPVYDTITVSVN